MKLLKMFSIVFLVLMVIVACGKKQSGISEGEYWAIGYHDLGDEDTGIEMVTDAIYVDSRGVTILSAEAVNAEGCWINKEIDTQGNQRTFKSFKEVNDMLSFKISKEGVYYIYPRINSVSSYAEIKVRYSIP